jgi:LysR family cyn operon transcriptional activator
MEVRQLNYFIKAAELLHFTDAAAASFVTQSTLSQQIKQLEGELGTPLFDRIGKQVRLTEAGNVFLIHARKIILEIKKSKQALFEYANMMNGELKIGVTYSFSSMLLPALTPFSEKYPGIKIHVESGAALELENKLKAADLDLVLAFHEQTEGDGLEMQHLFSSRVMMVVSKNNPLAKLSKITLKELGKTELILQSNGYSSRDMLNEIFRKNHISPDIKIEINDVHSLLSMVEAGNWVTIINEKAISTWDSLVAIPISGKELYRQASILWQQGVYRKRSAVLFMEELMKVV